MSCILKVDFLGKIFWGCFFSLLGFLLLLAFLLVNVCDKFIVLKPT
jgi:hypothetical protein